MSTGSPPDGAEPALPIVYVQLCASYHAIDDFRAKLLGFLPLASGAGFFLLLSDALVDPAKADAAKPFLLPIGIFGMVVTLGLFSYEIYGIKKCQDLILLGRCIEESMQVTGHFLKRPREVAGFINEPFAAGVIYPAVLSAWSYVALVFTGPRWVTAGVAGLVFLAGLLGSLAYNRRLKREFEAAAGL